MRRGTAHKSRVFTLSCQQGKWEDHSVLPLKNCLWGYQCADTILKNPLGRLTSNKQDILRRLHMHVRYRAGVELHHDRTSSQHRFWTRWKWLCSGDGRFYIMNFCSIPSLILHKSLVVTHRFKPLRFIWRERLKMPAKPRSPITEQPNVAETSHFAIIEEDLSVLYWWCLKLWSSPLISATVQRSAALPWCESKWEMVVTTDVNDSQFHC